MRIGARSQVDYFYDGEGRRDGKAETQTFSERNVLVVDRYVYGNAGRLVERTSAQVRTVTWSYTYDEKGRVLTESSSGPSIKIKNEWRYGDSGQLTKGTVSQDEKYIADDVYSYDEHGWGQKVEHGSTGDALVRTFTRDAIGVLLRVETRLRTGSLVSTEEYEMSKEGSPDQWIKTSGRPFPLQLEASKMFGLSPNSYEAESAGS